MAKETYNILDRFTGSVRFAAEIECAPDAPPSIKLGLAVKVAVKAHANLARADLTDADLTDANLAGAYLAGANLARANLARANLAGANLADANLADAYLAGANSLTDRHLRPFKADMWMTLAQNPSEVPALIAALRAGKVDGSQYEGDCACRVGTIANAANADYRKLDHNSDNPAERWFMMIRNGDKPGDETGGGYASGKALEWALEWAALAGVTIAAKAGQ